MGKKPRSTITAATVSRLVLQSTEYPGVTPPRLAILEQKELLWGILGPSGTLDEALSSSGSFTKFLPIALSLKLVETSTTSYRLELYREYC
jgi:hypothetical protein